MEELKNALEVIKRECAQHETCQGCPLYTVDGLYGYNYCSITREGDVPAEWNVEEMVDERAN